MKFPLGHTEFYAQLELTNPVILLHAFPLHSGMWSAQLPVIRKAGFTPIAIDAPGFGRSELSGQVSDMDLLADNAFTLWQRLELPPAVVMGLSMGGYAALRLSERHPEMLRALVLADTRTEADTPEALSNRYQTAKSVLTQGSSLLLETLVPKLLANSNAELKKQVADMISEASPEAIAAALRGMAIRPDSSRQLPAINVPTLVVVGAEDQLTPPSNAKALVQAIKQAKLGLIPNAGHLSNMENPQAFNKELSNFLDSL